MSKPIALSKNREIEYILIENRCDAIEEQVVFKLRTLPFNVRMDIFNSIAMDADSSGGVRADVGRKFRLACKHGIAGWDNLTDADGNVIEWRSTSKAHGVDVIEDSCLAILPDDVLVELGNAINEMSTSDAHQVGK